MIYVMSDIHGEYDRYRAMLELIGFDDEDRLYIIGDVIDRYPGGIDILRDVMTRPNITMLLGNHEQMCLDDLGLHNRAGARELWRSNGGARPYGRRGRRQAVLLGPRVSVRKT